LAGILNIADHWLAIERLKELSGNATFEAIVRRTLLPAQSEPVPPAYNTLWRLRLSGFVSSNLDRLASRSYVETKAVQVIEFTGLEVGGYQQILKSDRPFIVNIHGVAEYPPSWILTKTARDHLLSKKDYTAFLITLFSSFTVVFVGISADDVSAGGTLGRLGTFGIHTGEHFWITGRRDKETDDWAERNGLQVIRYDPTAGGHDRALQEICEDLQGFLPKDTVAPPVFEPAVSVPGLPDPEALSKYAPEDIRIILSANAAEILANKQNRPESEVLAAYDELCARYEQPLHNSWFVSESAPRSVLFGNCVEKRIASGAFGNVFKAYASDGSPVAIKLLRQEVRQVRPMLESFRRGVRSMRKLSERKVHGMVPYRHAYELPPCVVMDFVDGANLEQVVQSRQLERWSDTLRIMRDVAKIVRAGHLLPERVLHRDLRPANIMIKGFNVPNAEWEVVVLDFDLSWHYGATKLSVRPEWVTALGCLAPEQLTEMDGVSTRNTAVDSFGLAMTLYFMFSGKHPGPNENEKKDWPVTVSEAIHGGRQTQWKSAASRIERLILRATQHDQSSRPDLAGIENELERVHGAILDPRDVKSAELWAEELATRGCIGESNTWAERCRLVWSERLGQSSFEFPTGVALKVRGDEKGRRVVADIESLGAGDGKWGGMTKFMPEALGRARAKLQAGGWTVLEAIKGGYAMHTSAVIDVLGLHEKAGRAAEALRNTVSELAFK
jgi:hypothetical protein